MLTAVSRSALTFLVLVAGATKSQSAATSFTTFDGAKGLELTGAATVRGSVLRLTPAKRSKTGAFWLVEKQPIVSKFETTFQFQLTHPGLFGGADGLAFVIQNSGPRALGGRGSAGGFGVADGTYSHHPGIPWSFAVFFDTWQNSNEGDPSDNYIAIRSTGRPAEMHWPAERLAFTPNLAVQLKDQRVHTARVVYDRPVIEVFLDDSASPVLKTALDLSLVADSEGKAWVGFTASTGWGSENHDILSWSFRGEAVSSEISVISSEISFPMSACLPEHNLCTPEQSFIGGESGKYHVVLPGNSKWGV
ncbi:MAG: L-type lectin-domain containing protein, partial [Acidobacteriota bacterium]|nr:L-type lectin-domain containing protein [Acidobacteriota bacterium]